MEREGAPAVAGAAAVLDGVLAACRAPGPDAAARVARAVHAAASERMRSLVGDADTLARAFRTTLYAPLVGHRSAVAEAWDARGESVRCHLRVVAPDGGEAGFTVALTRARSGTRAGSWVLSGLVRDGVDL